METCELAENMFDLTAHWTLDGVTPTPASPGQCAGFDSFKLGAGDGSNGFAEEVTCADGVAQLPRVPATLFKVEAWAYRLESPTTGSFSVIGSASIDRADASEVTLAFVLP